VRAAEDHKKPAVVPSVMMLQPSYLPDIPEPPAVSGDGDEAVGEVVSKMDRRAWLEVLDRRHRYAKNLRAYHQAWVQLGMPGRDFWRWLDEGEGKGEEGARFELEHLPRSKLDRENVRYLTPQEAADYAVVIDKRDGTVRHAAGTRHPRSGAPLETGPGGFIFVLRRGRLFAAEKVTKAAPRFHHSSFFCGRPVAVAGMLIVRRGVLTRVLPHSGHYRPRDEHIVHLLRFLGASRIDLASLEVSE